MKIIFVLNVITFVFLAFFIENSKSAIYNSLFAKSNNTDYPDHCYDDFTKNYYKVGENKAIDYCGTAICSKDFSFELLT